MSAPASGTLCHPEVPMLDLKKLLIDVFDPQEGETVTVMVDLPTAAVPDNDGMERTT